MALKNLFSGSSKKTTTSKTTPKVPSKNNPRLNYQTPKPVAKPTTRVSKPSSTHTSSSGASHGAGGSNKITTSKPSTPAYAKVNPPKPIVPGSSTPYLNTGAKANDFNAKNSVAPFLPGGNTTYPNDPAKNNGFTGGNPTAPFVEKPKLPSVNIPDEVKKVTDSVVSNMANKGNNDNGSGGNSYDTTPTINNNFPGFDAYEKYISEYRKMLEENQKKLDQLAEENYKAQIAANEQNAKDQRNRANLNSARTDRWLNQQYGSGISGKGLTNQLRNQTALNNQIATINQNLASNNSVANLNRYNTLQGNLDNKLTKMASVDDSYLNYLKKLAGI